MIAKFKRIPKNINKADAILCADLHIRSSTPIGRIDDYINAQFNKLNFIFKLCKENNCPLLVAGDLGDKSQWPNSLLEMCISTVYEYGIEIIAIPGQHDLPEHNLNYWPKSGYGVLHSSYAIFNIQEPQTINDRFTLFPFPYGVKIKSPIYNHGHPRIAMIHKMVIENKPLWPGQNDLKGHEILKKFPEYDLILSGDNHNPFVTKYKNRILVNPGSMMRMTIAQAQYKPRVYKWFTKSNQVEPVFLPIEKNVMDTIYIEQHQQQINNCVFKIPENIEIGLLFENNIKKYIKTNNINKFVIQKIQSAINN